jgi:glycosyltransferase involved in cell wall biosynthesis
VKVNHPELKVHFTWVGKVNAYDQPLIEHDLQHAGLKEVVHFIGEVTQPAPVYGSFDIFLLPSREDPFPLVCIEVGAMGKPIVCFEGATGTAEVLCHGGGMIVPYLDVEAMGRAVVDYARDPERRRKDGELNRVQFANFGPDQQCPLMWQRITAAWNEQASKR